MHAVATADPVAGPSRQTGPAPLSTPLDSTRPTTSRRPTVEDIEDEDEDPFRVPPANTHPEIHPSDFRQGLNNPMTPARHVVFRLPEPPNPFGSSARRTPAAAASAARQARTNPTPTHEEFSFVYTPTSARGTATPATPTRRNHGRRDGTPRFGRHSTVRALREAGPAGNKRGKEATDIWPFFEESGNKRACKFCL